MGNKQSKSKPTNQTNINATRYEKQAQQRLESYHAEVNVPLFEPDKLKKALNEIKGLESNVNVIDIIIDYTNIIHIFNSISDSKSILLVGTFSEMWDCWEIKLELLSDQLMNFWFIHRHAAHDDMNADIPPIITSIKYDTKYSSDGLWIYIIMANDNDFKTIESKVKDISCNDLVKQEFRFPVYCIDDMIYKEKGEWRQPENFQSGGINWVCSTNDKI